MRVAVPPPTPTASRKVFMFVTRMMAPTAVPRMRAATIRTMKAARGAAMTPPTRSAATIPQGISAKLRAKKKPMLAATETRNSLVSTVPTTLRGSILPVEINVEVLMAPQPPPPAASRNPATRPKGERLLAGAILAPGKRTVSGALRVMGLGQTEHFQRYHRVLNRAVWSGREASRVLLGLLVRRSCPVAHC